MNQLPQDFLDEWLPLAGETSTFLGIPLKDMSRDDLLAIIAHLANDADKAREEACQSSLQGMRDLVNSAKFRDANLNPYFPGHRRKFPNPRDIFPVQPLPEGATPIYAKDPDFSPVDAVCGEEVEED